MMNHKSLGVIAVLVLLAVGLGYIRLPLPKGNLWGGYADCGLSNPCYAPASSNLGAVNKESLMYNSCIVNGLCYAVGRAPYPYEGQYNICGTPVAQGNSIEFSIGSCPAPTPPSTPPPQPSEANVFSDMISSFISVFQLLWQSIMSFFLPKGEVVQTSQQLLPGETFSHTFTLQNKLNHVLPDYNSADGNVTYAYIAKTVLDNAGTIMIPITEGTTEIVAAADAKAANAEWSRPFTYTIPASGQPGRWSAVAVLVTQTHIYNRTSNSWYSLPSYSLDNESATFDVMQMPGAPAPAAGSILTSIVNSIASILQNLICAFKQLIGLSC